MCANRHISDKQQRSLPEFARPEGSRETADFFVAPPRSSENYIFVVAPRNRLVSRLLKLICVRILHS